jgi:hypothetical protein
MRRWLDVKHPKPAPASALEGDRRLFSMPSPWAAALVNV